MERKILLIFTLFITNISFAQPDRWQQRAVYEMDIDFDVNTHQFDGNQELIYMNNSPDTLHKVFYHLYFNAFQPGSMMDVRSRIIKDPDRRVGDRIIRLKPNEIGYHIIHQLEQDGKDVTYEVVGTILEVELDHPILPGHTSIFDMKFSSQVPIQIRRSGRDNAEGIDYSMAQWYPKMAEYDYQGWHANPYVGREFYGIWGDFEVNITIDKSYIIGATGVLQNADEIGYGYSDEKGLAKSHKGDKVTWKFHASNVHDFVWAADPDYTHTKHMSSSGTELHFFYQENERTKENWENLPKVLDKALEFMNANYGKYPYPVYSFIQAGDGGMEYPMATLITGERRFGSLVGVSIHEWMHSWYHMMLGSNESLYPWMDEGFTSYGTSETMNYLVSQGLLPGETQENPHKRAIAGYVAFNSTGNEEAISTHADHYTSNRAYGVGAYTKGELFLHQLQYIIGDEAFKNGLLKYFDTWKFKHPNANDCIRVFEKESGLELDWYKEYWVYTTKTIDYGIDTVFANGQNTTISLSKIGDLPMPLDIYVEDMEGKEYIYNIPLRMMRGDKAKNSSEKMKIATDWPWVYPIYDLEIEIPMDKIRAVNIDKNYGMSDINRTNNEMILQH